MRINRFIIKGEDFVEDYTLRDEEIVKQINRVLKLKINEKVILFNGVDRKEYLYEIKEINKNNILLKLINTKVNESKINKKIILCQSIIKGGFEDIVRGATEIGVSQIYPIISDRAEKKSINISRNTKIIQEAIEQSGRCDIFFIENVYKMEEIFNKNAVNYVFHTVDIENNDNVGNNSEIKDREVSNDNKDIQKDIYVWVGPEGGYSDREIEFFKTNGAIFKHLPTYTLRAETAGLIAVYEVIRGIIK